MPTPTAPERSRPGNAPMLVLLFLVPIAFAAGYLLGTSGTEDAEQRGREEGKNAAMHDIAADLRDVGIVSSDEGGDVDALQVGGIVTAINTDSFGVTVTVTVADPIPHNEDVALTINTAGLPMFKRVPADEETFAELLRQHEEALLAFENAMATQPSEVTDENAIAPEPPVAPEPFTEQKVSLSDVFIGDGVSLIFSEPVSFTNLTSAVPSRVLFAEHYTPAPSVEPDPERAVEDFPLVDDPDVATQDDLTPNSEVPAP